MQNNNTSTSTRNPGDRIRMVRMNVTVQTEQGQLIDQEVTVKHAWPDGGELVHMCNADMCESCTGLAGRKALRRLEVAGKVARSAAKATAFEVLRDRQTVAR